MTSPANIAVVKAEREYLQLFINVLLGYAVSDHKPGDNV